MIKELAKCNVVYVDRRAKSERNISREDLPLNSATSGRGTDLEHEEVVRNVDYDDAQEVDRHDSGIASSLGEDPLYGRALLRHIRAEMEAETYSQNILTVALMSEFDHVAARRSIDGGYWTASDEEETVLASKLLDTGAAEAFPSPLTKENTKALSMHCYRLARKAQKRRSERKRSWVGVDTDLEAEERERKNNIRVAEGYAYLREKM
ncbi:hypothetical protein ABW19_dt0202480 [Dactylella cylindrospora]|nr:hypothetical protein ABW19_dt0202480 [Dactylella cylindrospora]